MNIETKLLSERDSASLAGVSLDTIRRFHQFGLLKSTEKEGEKLFAESEIRSLFNVGAKITPSPADKESPIDFRVIPGGRQELPGEEQEQPNTSAEAKTAIPAAMSDTPENNKPSADIESPEQRDEIPPFSGKSASGASQSELFPKRYAPSGNTVLTLNHSLNEIQNAEQILEFNLILRQQVLALTEERNWLRARIEKLESLSEREHSLLLSNNETVRELLMEQRESRKKKKGFFAHLLGWIAEPTKKI